MMKVPVSHNRKHISGPFLYTIVNALHCCYSAHESQASHARHIGKSEIEVDHEMKRNDE